MFLKNRNISSKIERSKVTDYAALNYCIVSECIVRMLCAFRMLYEDRRYLLFIEKQKLVVSISFFQTFPSDFIIKSM